MYTTQKYRPISRKRMNSVLERRVVNGVGLGLGEVDGLFNIGKMFTRLVTIKPSSFKLSNLMGAVGSLTMFTASGGLSTLAPKLTGAHSALSKDVGMATVAVAAVAGGAALMAAPAAVGGTAATGVGLTTTGIGTASAGSTEIAAALAPEAASSGFFSAVGSGISSVGSGLMNVVKALPFVGNMIGGGGQQQQQGGMTQAEYDAQQQQQAAYDAQVRAQQAQMYQPGYVPEIPYVPGQYTGMPMAPTADMNTSYGDLRSPYTAIAEDGSTVQVDPRTGEVISPGISTPMMIAIGGITLLAGWYLMSDSKSTN
jgi:hypothetical protein